MADRPARTVSVRLLFLFALALHVDVALADAIEAAPQRPSFSTDTSTTAPGTLELELGTAASPDFFGLPAVLKVTPGVASGPLNGTEFSVGFDALTSTRMGGNRTTRFGDRMGFALRRAVYQGENFSLALAPQALFFLRDENGARLGAAVIAVYSSGLNSVVGNFIWSAATSASASNPARQYAWIAGYSRTLGHQDTLSRLSVFGEYLQESPSDASDSVSLIQGLSYRVRPDVVIDVAVQEFGLALGLSEVQFVAGLTINLGRVLPGSR